MAETREILGSLPMGKLPTKSSVCSHLNGHQQITVSSSNSLRYNSRKSMLVQVRKVVATPMAAHIKAGSIKAAAAETPVQFEVKALVTVKYDTKEYVKDMMFRWLDSDGHTAQRGVILQLVSTQVDPSKHPVFFLH